MPLPAGPMTAAVETDRADEDAVAGEQHDVGDVVFGREHTVEIDVNIGLADALDDDVAERAVFGRATGGKQCVHERAVGGERLEPWRPDVTVDARADAVQFAERNIEAELLFVFEAMAARMVSVRSLYFTCATLIAPTLLASMKMVPSRSTISVLSKTKLSTDFTRISSPGPMTKSASAGTLGSTRMAVVNVL